MADTQEAFPNHTVAGKLLIIATVCFAIAAFVFVVLEGKEFLPSGHYPIALFLCAIAPAVLAFYVLGTLLLRLLGVPIRKPTPDQSALRRPELGPPFSS